MITSGTLSVRLLQVLAAVAPLAAASTGCSQNCYGADRDFSYEVDLRPETGPIDDVGSATIDAGPSIDAGASTKSCKAICDEHSNDRGGTTVVGCAFITSVKTGGPAVRCDAHEQRRCYSGNVQEGRRPAGLIAAERVEGTLLGTMFAQMAHLEAASVPAFLLLGRELAAHGAPSALVDDAKRAARDEVRHRRVMSALARRHGAEPPPVEVMPHDVRPLEAIAIENAIEGCVRETYGALVAHWQAENAADAELRETMTEIAYDETRHAELAFAVAEWIDTKLDDGARARVAAARTHAIGALRDELMVQVPRELVREAGLPSAPIARALADAAARTIWS